MGWLCSLSASEPHRALHNLVAHPPTRAADLMIFTVIADISILTLNLSLMVNTVSFYQVQSSPARGCLHCIPLLRSILSPAPNHHHPPAVCRAPCRLLSCSSSLLSASSSASTWGAPSRARLWPPSLWSFWGWPSCECNSCAPAPSCVTVRRGDFNSLTCRWDASFSNLPNCCSVRCGGAAARLRT